MIPIKNQAGESRFFMILRRFSRTIIPSLLSLSAEIKGLHNTRRAVRALIDRDDRVMGFRIFHDGGDFAEQTVIRTRDYLCAQQRDGIVLRADQIGNRRLQRLTRFLGHIGVFGGDPAAVDCFFRYINLRVGGQNLRDFRVALQILVDCDDRIGRVSALGGRREGAEKAVIGSGVRIRMSTTANGMTTIKV